MWGNIVGFSSYMHPPQRTVGKLGRTVRAGSQQFSSKTVVGSGEMNLGLVRKTGPLGHRGKTEGLKRNIILSFFFARLDP